MNIALLYLLLLKGTCTAFAGLASLPVIHDTLVTQHGVLTEQQLNQAVVITRSSPGPVPADRNRPGSRALSGAQAAALSGTIDVRHSGPKPVSAPWRVGDHVRSDG